MDRGKIIAIFTGTISILIAIAYLVLVQVLDFRGEMIPAPVGQFSPISFHFPTFPYQFSKSLVVEAFSNIFKLF